MRGGRTASGRNGGRASGNARGGRGLRSRSASSVVPPPRSSRFPHRDWHRAPPETGPLERAVRSASSPVPSLATPFGARASRENAGWARRDASLSSPRPETLPAVFLIVDLRMPLVGVAARFASAARAAMRRAPAGLALAGSSAGTGAVRGAPGSLASGATPGARVGVRGVRFAARSNGWIAAGPVPASAFASASPGAVVGCSERLGGPGSLRPIWLRALHAPSLAARARRYPGEGPSEPIPKPKRISKGARRGEAGAGAVGSGAAALPPAFAARLTASLFLALVRPRAVPRLSFFYHRVLRLDSCPCAVASCASVLANRAAPGAFFSRLASGLSQRTCLCTLRVRRAPAAST